MRNLFLFIILSFAFSVYSIDYEGFYIAHGGGGIEGRTYTNSLESLNSSYEQGFRFFELDIIEDIYGNILAAHDWTHWKSITSCDSIFEKEVCDTTTTTVTLDSISISIKCDTLSIIVEDTIDIIIECDTSYITVEYDSLVTNVDCELVTNIVTEEHFLTHKIYDKFTPMNMEMINQWFADHEDAVLVTDKIDDPEKMDSLFVDKARLYMELFSFKSIAKAKELGINYMMSENVLHKLGENKFEYLIENEIPALAVSRRLIERDEYKELFLNCKANNIKVWVFHVNFNTGKDEKYVYDNEMQYIYGMYADKWINEFNSSITTDISALYSDKFAVSYREGILSVKSAEEIKSIFVYNISGTLIANYSDINSLECQTLIDNNDGLLIVKIQTTDSIEILKIY